MQETQYLKLFSLPITTLHFPDSGAKFSVSKTNRFSRRVVNELVILYKLVISCINKIKKMTLLLLLEIQL